MRVLVTGASGFSGSFVAAALAEAGHEVVGLYRHETSFLARIKGLRRLETVRLALADVATLRSDFDAVVHAAATSPAPGVGDAEIIRDNRDGTAALIAAAMTWPCRSFVFFSSLSLYGEIAVPVIDEATPVTRPDTYGLTKQQGEALLASHADRLPGLALRLPGVLGKGAHRNWLSGAATKLLAGQVVPAYGLDEPYNNAAHIADVAALVRRAIERGFAGFDAVVLGARGTLSMRGVIERLAAGLGVAARIEPIPPPKRGFILSSERAIERWGYDPMEIGAMIDRYTRELREVF